MIAILYDLANILTAIQSMRSEVTAIRDKMETTDNFGSELDTPEGCISDRNNSVVAVERGLGSLRQDITANAKRLTEAEHHIGSTRIIWVV